MSVKLKLTEVVRGQPPSTYAVKKLLDNLLDQDGGGGDDEGMDNERIKRLEEFADDAKQRLARIETHMDSLATKEDVANIGIRFQDAINAQIKWIVGTAGVLGGTGIVVMTFVLNNAITKPPVPSAPAPTIIQIPYQAQPLDRVVLQNDLPENQKKKP